jgi:hypothetical protein
VTQPAEEEGAPDSDGHVRRTLVRVMGVQVVALALLWFLQHRYGH